MLRHLKKADGKAYYRLWSEARKVIVNSHISHYTFDQHSMSELLEPGTEIEATNLETVDKE
jgi:hypothetical protein